MHFHVPAELTDSFIVDSLTIAHGELMSIVELTEQVDALAALWLSTRSAWTFYRTSLVACSDGSPHPSYDVRVLFRRPRTPLEVEAQTREREAWIQRHEEEYARRSMTQRAILEEVLASLDRHEP